MSEHALEDRRRQVAAVPAWRHRIDLGDGLVTPGPDDMAVELARLRFPSVLDGERVLDIGTSDGGATFLAEQRGAAELVAIDDESSTLAGAGRNGFRVASALLGSKARYAARDVEDLEPAIDGAFDRVLFLNVLYHLKNPLRALERIAGITKPGGTLYLKTYFRTDVRVWWRGRCYGFDVDARPKWWFFPDAELGGDPTNWFAPNRSALEGALQATGWTDVRPVARHLDRVYCTATRS